MKRFIKAAWDGYVPADQIMKESDLNEEQAQLLSDYIYDEHLDEGFSSLKEFLDETDLDDIYKSALDIAPSNSIPESNDDNEDDIPITLERRPYILSLNSVDPADDETIHEVAERFGALKVKYRYKEGNRMYNKPQVFAVFDTHDAERIYKEITEDLKIPVKQSRLSLQSIDWTKCYQIRLTNFYPHKSSILKYHSEI